MLDNFRKSKLASLVNSEFNIEPIEGGSSVVGKLIEVEDSSCNGDKWEAFTAAFSLPEGTELILGEKEYLIKHDEIGEVALFGSPNSENELEFCCTFRLDDE